MWFGGIDGDDLLNAGIVIWTSRDVEDIVVRHGFWRAMTPGLLVTASRQMEICSVKRFQVELIDLSCAIDARIDARSQCNS